jgi:hypothetical protein
MKNIHIIPTDKPSRLWMTKLGNLARCNDIQPIKEELGHNVNIYITNLEEIKDGWSYDRMMRTVNKIDNVYSSKIILTTDPDLIKDGVQSIDDEFLQWFVQNPSCEWVKTAKGKMKLNDDGQEYGFPDMSKYKIIISQEEPKQEDEIIDISDHDGIGNAVDNLNNEEPEKETLEEAAENFANSKEWINGGASNWVQFSFKEGAKWMQERMYSEEEMIEFYLFCITELLSSKSSAKSPKELFEQFKKK